MRLSLFDGGDPFVVELVERLQVLAVHHQTMALAIHTGQPVVNAVING
ncbi:protein of unknown function [Limnospira indica PCC 8005]|uniref:Uncharacterized protein n=1 Tax=Limnospira indica PCC 8005 TaxID=376219 RepID=A0A9P1KLK0_9CYAN|nr:protein of unknown function [Limnospira indica PCC 8005]